MHRTIDAIPLSQLKPGQQAIIVHVGGSRHRRRRAVEMGFVKGEKVLVKRIAPLGDPIEYLIKGYHLSLRQSDASQILVQTGGEDRDG